MLTSVLSLSLSFSLRFTLSQVQSSLLNTSLPLNSLILSEVPTFQGRTSPTHLPNLPPTTSNDIIQMETVSLLSSRLLEDHSPALATPPQRAALQSRLDHTHPLSQSLRLSPGLGVQRSVQWLRPRTGVVMEEVSHLLHSLV